MTKRILSVACLLWLLLIVYTTANPTSVVRTIYPIETDKVTKPYRVVFLSDLHYGCVQNKRVVSKALDAVAQENPDIVILGGDIIQVPVTPQLDISEIFSLLGDLPARDGIYFVYGNHEFTNQAGYMKSDLDAVLKDNDIHILCGESILLPDNICLSSRNIYTGVTLTLNDTAYNICAEHIPVRYPIDGVDLFLAGHTHGGQVFPLNLAVKYDWKMPVYGKQDMDDMTSIVTSGMGVSSFHARNLHRCEYVVIDILPQQERK